MKRGTRRLLLVLLAAFVAVWLLQNAERSAPPPEAGSRATAAPASRPLRAPRVFSVRDEEASLRELAGVVRSARGGMLADATVCVFQRAQTSRAPQLCDRSDARGRFVLRGVEIGTVRVSAPGYVPQTKAFGAEEVGSVLVFTLEPGGAELSGEVVDALGGAIAGALVHARGSDSGEEPAVVISDASGRFTLSVPAGEVELEASAEAYSSLRRRVAAPARGVRLPLSAAASIEGRAVSIEDGAPLEAVRVSAVSQSGGEPSLVTETGREGAFMFSGLRGGDYELAVIASGWRGTLHSVSVDAGQATRGVLLEAALATTLSGVVLVEGTPCSQAALELSGAPATYFASAGLDGSARFEGVLPGHYRMYIDCPRALSFNEEIEVSAAPLVRRWELDAGLVIEGRVESPSGRAAPDVWISVRPAREGSTKGVGCVSDARGTFACSGLLPGEYDCEVASPAGSLADPVRVSVADADTPRVVLRLQAMASIRAFVRSEGLGEKGALAVFARRDGGFPVQGEPRGGAFVFERLPLGRYVLSVGSALDEGSARAAVLLERDGQRVDVELDAPQIARLTGRVVDAQGAPVFEARISAQPMDPYVPPNVIDALTDEDGRFELSELVPGEYELHATTAWGQTTPVAAQTSAADVLLRMQPSAALAVEVSDASGAPVAMFSIAVGRAGSAQTGGGRAGSWEAVRLVPGVYQIAIESDPGNAARDVTLAPGETARVALRVQEVPISATLIGTLRSDPQLEVAADDLPFEPTE